MKRILIIVIIIVILILGYSISVTPSYDTIDISAALEKARSALKENQEIIVFESKWILSHDEIYLLFSQFIITYMDAFVANFPYCKY